MRAPRSRNAVPGKRKPCSEEQGFPYFKGRPGGEIGAREIGGEEGTKVRA